MNSRLLKSLLWLAPLLLVLSCSNKKAIVGIWQYSETSFMEFRGDGTYLMHGIGASQVTGHYRFTGRGKVKVDIDGGKTQASAISIKGDEMTMTGGGATVKLRRADLSAVKRSDEQWKVP
jgi:hypothetical protein